MKFLVLAALALTGCNDHRDREWVTETIGVTCSQPFQLDLYARGHIGAYYCASYDTLSAKDCIDVSWRHLDNEEPNYEKHQYREVIFGPTTVEVKQVAKLCSDK